MIPLNTLDLLIAQRTSDARALLNHGRNSAAVYLMGYALELALKRKICTQFNFTTGFPESQSQLNSYLQSIPASSLAGIIAPQINDIKNHNFNKLLFYSGVEYRIKRDYFNEWPYPRYGMLK